VSSRSALAFFHATGALPKEPPPLLSVAALPGLLATFGRVCTWSEFADVVASAS
jgi:hypothetical protein